jgi:hypothetical protein
MFFLWSPSDNSRKAQEYILKLFQEEFQFIINQDQTYLEKHKSINFKITLMLKRLGKEIKSTSTFYQFDSDILYSFEQLEHDLMDYITLTRPNEN